jgi:PPOX class probable F420-dependent enzyme
MTMSRTRSATGDFGPLRSHDPDMNAAPASRRSEAQRAVPSAAADARLRSTSVAWLSTTNGDGTPALVPVWFLWDGESFIVFSKPHARKVRNIRDNAAVMLAVGEPEDDFDVQLVEGRAELLDAPEGDILRALIATKYRGWLDGIGLGLSEFGSTYAQAIRITPTRFLPWRGRTWIGQSRRQPGFSTGSGPAFAAAG